MDYNCCFSYCCGWFDDSTGTNHTLLACCKKKAQRFVNTVIKIYLDFEVLPAEINHFTKHTSLNDVTEPLVVDDEQPNNVMTTMSMLTCTQ